MARFLVGLLLSLVLTSLASPSIANAQDWYTKAVKSVDCTVTPAEAKPGDTVVLRITVTLEDGYHTYPLIQSDKKAAEMVNKLTLPESNKAGLIFVGENISPKNVVAKEEPALGIKEMHIVKGIAVFERKAVVSPKAQPGELEIKGMKFELQICNETNCFAPKKLLPEVKFKIKTGEPVEVEKEYKEAVEKVISR